MSDGRARRLFCGSRHWSDRHTIRMILKTLAIRLAVARRGTVRR